MGEFKTTHSLDRSVEFQRAVSKLSHSEIGIATEHFTHIPLHADAIQEIVVNGSAFLIIYAWHTILNEYYGSLGSLVRLFASCYGLCLPCFSCFGLISKHGYQKISVTRPQSLF